MFGFNYFFKVCTHPLNRFHICIRRKKITYLLLEKKYCLKWKSNRKMSRKSMDVGIHKWIESTPAYPSRCQGCVCNITQSLGTLSELPSSKARRLCHLLFHPCCAKHPCGKLSRARSCWSFTM